MQAISRPVVKIGPDGRMEVDDVLAVERPLELRLDGVPLAVLMCSPGMEDELALGFCITEGILVAPDELAGVEPVGVGDRFQLILAPGVEVDPERFRRNAYTTSSCGVCGKASIDAVRIAARSLPPGPLVSPSQIVALPELLRPGQEIFDLTGGLHGAGIFTADGEPLAMAEDVGRHNAVDKAIGSLAARQWPLGELIMVVSGRISFEITQKAGVAGIPVIVGVSAASSLAAELAEELGMTVIGFTRAGRFVIYSGAQRVGR